MSKKLPMMSWNDRFALIDAHKPSNAAICAAFGLTPAELKTANALRNAGTFRPNPKLDVNKFGAIFQEADVSQSEDATGKTGTTTSHRPESFTKKSVIPKAPQKRGRKGDKIANALMAVTNTPVPVDSFVQQHGVSVAVLRQSKRFLENMSADVVAKIGRIQVKQDKTSKTLMIWREDV